MIQNFGYTLKYLAGVPYLLPYGQMIADHRRGTKINDTGVYLWNLLATEHTMEEVINTAGAYYQITENESAEFEKEIRQYINTLSALGILLDSSSDLKIPQKHVENYNIAGLNLQFINFRDTIPHEFDAFHIDAPAQSPDLTLIYHTGRPFFPENGTMLLRNYELNVMELENKYILTLPQSPEIFEIHISKDGLVADIYTIPLTTDEYKEKLFHAIRLPFLYTALKHDMVAIHSASILYQNRAWLFSAPSGTGKSTHAGLWKEHLRVSTINGDLNLLAMNDVQPVIHGIPWCGTSGIYDTKSYPLGGIILLRQATHDRITELTADEKQLLISQRFISPSWTMDLFDKSLDLAGQIAERSLICRLNCTKEKSALETMQTRIDKYLEDAR